MSKSRGRKTSTVERGRKVEREYGMARSHGRSREDDYGDRDHGYADFRDYEFGDARYNSFPRMQAASVHLRPSIYEAYDGYEGYEIPAVVGRSQYAHGYSGGRGSSPYGEEGVGYGERRRFSVPIPNHDPYLGFQPRYREATSLPDIRTRPSVEEQIDELLGAVERSSLSDSDASGALDGISEEVERQLVDMKAEKRGYSVIRSAVVECVALEDLPPVVQTIATAREDARLEFEEEMGYGSQETDNVAPMLVDLFALAQLLAQETM
jgi:hypothetical protein